MIYGSKVKTAQGETLRSLDLKLEGDFRIIWYDHDSPYYRYGCRSDDPKFIIIFFPFVFFRIHKETILLKLKNVKS